MKVKESTVHLQVKDGTKMPAFVATPEGHGPFPGIIVFQEAFGVNHHMKEVTARFAREGFIAICPELYHRTAEEGFSASYTDFQSLAPHMQAMTNDGLLADIDAAWQWINQQPTLNPGMVVSTGYCMGGRVSFLANTRLPLKAAVSYYGAHRNNEALDRTAEASGPVLFYWGGLDQHITQESIDNVINHMKDAGKEYVNVVFSNADHGFNCDERAQYNEEASLEAWSMTLRFLHNKLKLA